MFQGFNVISVFFAAGDKAFVIETFETLKL